MAQRISFPHPVWRFALLLCCLFISLPSIATVNPLTLTGPIKETRLEPYISWFCEAGKDLGLDDIQELTFHPPADKAIVLGHQAGACWFHFQIENQSQSDQSLILNLANPAIDHINFYALNPSPSRIQTGDNQPFSQRPIKTRNFTFPVTISAGTTQDFYLQTISTNSIFIPLTASSTNNFIAESDLSGNIHGLGIGIIAGLLFYQIFLTLAARESISRYYIFYLASSFFYLLCLKGYGYQLWPTHPIWNGHSHLFFVSLMLFSGVLFARDYLKKYLTPTANHLLIGSASISLVFCALQFIIPLGMSYRLQNIIALIAILSICWAVIHPVRMGNRECILFLFSWVLLATTGILLALQSLGIINSLPFTFSLIGTELAFILQQLILAFAVSYRLESLKQEAQATTEQAIRSQAENAAKSDFLAKMSHEIRTPMNALMGITQLLQDTDLDKTQKGYVDTLYSSSFAMLTVINDILDYSKITAGKIDLRSEPFNLLDLLDECIQIFSLNAREKSLALVCERSRDLPAYVRGDADRLRQILLNLLSNAIKFTDYGNVFLRASLEETDGTISRLRFEVEDTGIGIEASQMPHLFKNFSQIESASTRRYGGSGLGLAISRQLVELMGGKITVDSTPQRGTTFRFTVNVNNVFQGDKFIDQRTQAISPTLFSGIRALVVEDNPINQMVIRGLLTKVGLEVKVVGGGQEALDTLAAEPREAYDLVFMDCEMPGMDGFETSRRLREWETASGRYPLPVIALTAHALPEHLQHCLDAGMDDYLTKPLLLPHLVEKLQVVLG